MAAKTEAATFSLNEDQRKTLVALCDTIFPRLGEAEEAELLRKRPDVDAGHLKAFCRTAGSDVQAHLAIEAAIVRHLPEDSQQKLSGVLSMLGSRIGMLALTGRATPFHQLPLSARTEAMNHLRTSWLWQKRSIFMLFKNLTVLKAMTLDNRKSNPHNHGQDQNSLWAALSFEGPAPWEQVKAENEKLGREEHMFEMINKTITKDTVLDFDVVIVGSGCGGAVSAAELSQAGKRVLVLDKGVYKSRSELTSQEGDAFDNLYDYGGLLSTEDSAMGLLAGSCFGGGSQVNWACSLETPQYVREEWASKHGLPAFTDGTFQKSLEVVLQRIAVKKEGIEHSVPNQLLIKGCENLGYTVEATGQNMASVSWFEGGGFIGTTDRYGNKQSATETWLRDAASASTPAQFAHKCEVDVVNHEKGAVKGVQGRIVGADGKMHKLVVRAPIVVVSCGSLQSPALLLRSKIPNGQIGKNLRLHPVTGAVGIMPKDQPTHMWRGAPMTAVSSVAADGPDKDHYGAKIEVPLLLPGLMGSSLPWTSGANFKELYLNYQHALPLIVLLRDKDSGEVKIDKDGRLRVHYPITQNTQEGLLHGLEKSLRILDAAGAEQVALGAMESPIRLPPTSDPAARKKVIDQVMATARAVGFPKFKVGMSSAHQMGSCRMGGSRESSVVKPTGESWECQGLYVSDASCFPTSSGVNPMVTTYSIAHMTAQHIKARASSRL